MRNVLFLFSLATSPGIAAAAGCGASDARSMGHSADAGADSRDDGAPSDGPAQDAGDAVVGTVVDLSTSRPLAGRIVAIGGQQATTDSDGRFILPADAIYDAVVVEPDNSEVSIFKGLARRDPVLSHRGSANIEQPSRVARITGTVSGGGTYPLGATDVVSVYFFSPEADSYALLGGGLPPNQDGPNYGPMAVTWTGPSTITGQLFALGMFGDTADAGYSYWFDLQDLMLANGQHVLSNISLGTVASSPLSGTIEVPTGFRVAEHQVFYKLPFPHAVVAVVNEPTTSPSFSYRVPQFSATEATLCIEEVGSPGLLVTQQCGVAPGSTNLAVTLQAPPAILSPTAGSAVSTQTSFMWSTFTDGIYELSLEASVPSRTTPSFHIFTANTAAVWPDLTALGIAHGSGTYQCQISGIGPFRAIDDMLGPEGLSARLPPELRWSSSDPFDLTAEP